jgi:DNA-binding NarL/FixJ family response regulator
MIRAVAKEKELVINNYNIKTIILLNNPQRFLLHYIELLYIPYSDKSRQIPEIPVYSLLFSILFSALLSWGLDIILWYKQRIDNGRLPKIAVYTSFDDYPNFSTALGMGVDAYICKHRSEQELEAALLQALNGKIHIDDTIQTRINTIDSLINILTKREGEVLSHVKKGMSNKQIASCLGISLRRVENILCCVYDKTGIKTRLELQQL